MPDNRQLSDMKLPELKNMAKELGLRGTSTMRKPELVTAIEAAQGANESVEDTIKSSVKSSVKSSGNSEGTSADSFGVINRSSDGDFSIRRRNMGDNPILPRFGRRSTPSRSSSPSASIELPSRRSTVAARFPRQNKENRDFNLRDNVLRDSGMRDSGMGSGMRDSSSRDSGMRDSGMRDSGMRDSSMRDSFSRDFGMRNSGLRDSNDFRDRGRRSFDKEPQKHYSRNLNSILDSLPERNPNEEQQRSRMIKRDENHIRRLRDNIYENLLDRETARDAAVSASTPTLGPEEFVPVAGIIEILESYAFVRTSGYLPGPNDVYVSMGQVKKYGLRKGDAVRGSIRATRDSDRRNQRQKYVPLQSIESINGMTVAEAANRPHFAKLTPLYPNERLVQETSSSKLTGRIIDIVSPIGKGQRGLIVSPPKAGKTITLQNIANSITENNPEVHLMVVLVDERPEEVTDMERTVQGEVISSTFDRPAADHTVVAELAIERAKRLVELGQDVVVLLDSMTRLARAYNIAAPASGRILSGGVDAQALYPPKKFFGAARNIENGGSLTIISSALVETGSKMDEVIFEEFKGTGNMELCLSRDLSEKRMFPAIDINASGTRREEMITNPEDMATIYRLRRALGGLEPEQAYQQLVPRLRKTASNREFMDSLTKNAPAGSSGGQAS